MAKKRKELDLLELLPLLDDEMSPSCSTLKELAEHLGLSLKEVRHWKSMGMPVTEYGDYNAGAIEDWAEENVPGFKNTCRIVPSIQEVASVLNVNRRTVAEWKSLGMPRTADGKYDIDQIMAWVDQRDISQGRKPRFSEIDESERSVQSLHEMIHDLEDLCRSVNEQGQVSARELSLRLTCVLQGCFRTLGEGVSSTIQLAEGTREEIRSLGDDVAYCGNLMNRKIVQAAYDRADELQPKADKKRRPSAKGAK